MNGAPLTLLPYQRRWVCDPAAVRVAVKSRRVGLSWAQAYADVIRAARDGDVTYISYDLEMTEGYLDDCSFWLEQVDMQAQRFGARLTGKRTKSRLKLASGYGIEALASKARKLRSRGRAGAHFDIDEAAFINDLPAMLDAVQGATLWGATVAIWSTHNGADNPFALLIEQIEAGSLPYSLHRVPLKLALAEGLYQRIVALKRWRLRQDGADGMTDTASLPSWSPEAECKWELDLRARYPSAEAAAEELDCIARPVSSSWLDSGDVSACQDVAAGDPRQYHGGLTWIGYDLARRNDLSVLTVVEQWNELFWVREVRVMRDCKFADQQQVVDELIQRYRPLACWVDQTGMGEGIVEQLRARHGHRIEGILLVGKRRLEIAQVVRHLTEQRRVRYPCNQAYRADLLSLRHQSADGLRASRNKDQGHADRFWSVGLALAAAQSISQVIYSYRPVKRRIDYRIW